MKESTMFAKPNWFDYEGPVFSINNKVCANCGEPHIYMADKELYDDTEESGTATCSCCGALYEIPFGALGLDFSKLSLVTSNPNKLEEYRQLNVQGLSIKSGLDLDEVAADPKTVITYKSLAAGKGTIVEDTSLFVHGAEIGTNIRWDMDRLVEFIGRKAVFEVWLGANLGKAIVLYRGTLSGRICQAPETPGPVFGFDNNFIPNHETRTLHQLALAGDKHKHSPRRVAILNMIGGAYEAVIVTASLAPWEGDYQHPVLK